MTGVDGPSIGKAYGEWLEWLTMNRFPDAL